MWGGPGARAELLSTAMSATFGASGSDATGARGVESRSNEKTRARTLCERGTFVSILYAVFQNEPAVFLNMRPRLCVPAHAIGNHHSVIVTPFYFPPHPPHTTSIVPDQGKIYGVSSRASHSLTLPDSSTANSFGPESACGARRREII